MSTESQVVIGIDIDQEDDNNKNNKNANNHRITELITKLMSAFQPRVFTEVATELISREEDANREMERLRRENKEIKEKHDMERLMKTKLESELQSCKDENWELTQSNSSLSENLKLIIEREKNTEERNRALVEDVKRMGQEDKEVNLELRRKLFEAENSKRRVDSDLEISRRRYGELDARVLRVWEELELLKAGPPQRGLGGDLGVNSGGLGEKVFEVKTEVVDGTDDFPDTGATPSLQNVIEIIDSDDETVPRSMLNVKDTISQKQAGSSQSGLKRKVASYLNTGGYEDADHEDQAVSSSIKGLQKIVIPLSLDAIWKRCEKKVKAEHNSRSHISYSHSKA
ncbi:hypothetical protein CFOL_v3_07064 [Cephalotus follicularis]|uniref:Uncharacterized protein n=1 Tax=Cephalotus follicularis TaxID=3775 RepID=A0A1Q3B657_CEPFO|nr:hypothetical protein CFOL_v3_07064 [Cephalotus follicularis]